MSPVVTIRKFRKVKELDRFVTGIDVGVNCGRIGGQHVSHAWTLNANLGAEKGKALAVNSGPDFLLAGTVRVRLTHGERIQCNRDDALLGGEPIGR